MNTPIAIALLATLAFYGCASPTQNTPHSMTEQDASVYELQHAKMQSKFPQYGKRFYRTNETRIVNGKTYNLWVAFFYQGTERHRRVWLDASGVPYNYPQFGDSTVLSDPPVNATEVK